MATWSTRRKYTYFFFFVTGLVLFIGIPTLLFLYEKPTCSDGKQNGSERGVDCGGSCTRLCPADFSDPRMVWSYSMRIVPGVYNALAYAQNPNQNVEAKSVPYTFKFYDAGGGLISERKGSVYVPPGQRFPIFEGGIQTQKEIVKTTFEFGAVTSWRAASPITDLKVTTTHLNQGDKPNAEVVFKNISLNKSYSKIDAFIILYDAQDNRVGFSKTVVDRINMNESQSMYFTWQEPFVRPVVRTEVLFVVRPLK